jgi:hypothetical protein
MTCGRLSSDKVAVISADQAAMKCAVEVEGCGVLGEQSMMVGFESGGINKDRWWAENKGYSNGARGRRRV